MNSQAQQISINKPVERDSNVELLRLVCMFFIVLHHILVHGAFPDLLKGGSAIDTPYERIAMLINGFTYIGVNVFILISGYYGIKVSFKKFFNLYTFCAFYGLVGYICHIVQTGQHIGRSLIYSTFLPFSHSAYWFIPCYFALFCLSPLLNEFIKRASKKDFIIALILATFVNIWMGFIWGNEVNDNGFNTMQFIFIYCIGGYIGRFADIQKCKEKRLLLSCIYIASAIIWAIFGIVQNKHWTFCYNNPILIIGALSFFMLSVTFSFKSRFINYLSSSALAVYLIQSMPFTRNILYRIAGKMVTDVNLGGGIYFIFILASIFITISCCLFDKIRILIMKPVWHIYYKIESRILKKNELCSQQ